MKKIVLSIITTSLMLTLGACSKKEVEEVKVEEKLIEEENKEPIKEQKMEEKQIEEKSGIRNEVKEALDSYEKFIDEYIVFMEKYEQTEDVGSMMADYLTYMQKYSDLVEKIDALENELTDEELVYYSEVTLRCSNKLMNAAI